MTTVKRTVTLDANLERDARALAGENFSAFVSDAVERHVRRVKLDRLVAADVAERGPLDEDLRAEVQAEMAARDAELASPPATTEPLAHLRPHSASWSKPSTPA